MATKTLIEKIEALPPERRAEVEHFVDDLTTTGAVKPATFPAELLEKINTEREALRRDHGLFDTQPILRDLRENGGR